MRRFFMSLRRFLFKTSAFGVGAGLVGYTGLRFGGKFGTDPRTGQSTYTPRGWDAPIYYGLSVKAPAVVAAFDIDPKTGEYKKLSLTPEQEKALQEKQKQEQTAARFMTEGREHLRKAGTEADRGGLFYNGRVVTDPKEQKEIKDQYLPQAQVEAGKAYGLFTKQGEKTIIITDESKKSAPGPSGKK